MKCFNKNYGLVESRNMGDSNRKTHFNKPESSRGQFSMNRPQGYIRGKTTLRDKGDVSIPASLRRGLGNRDIQRVNFDASVIKPRSIEHFSNLQVMGFDQAGIIKPGEYRELALTSKVKIPDDTDFKWLREKERLQQVYAAQFAGLGTPAEIKALVEKELRLNPPLGREQRTTTKTVNRVSDVGSLTFDKKLTELLQAVRANGLNGQDARRDARAQLVQILADTNALSQTLTTHGRALGGIAMVNLRQSGALRGIRGAIGGQEASIRDIRGAIGGQEASIRDLLLAVKATPANLGIGAKIIDNSYYRLKGKGRVQDNTGAINLMLLTNALKIGISLTTPVINTGARRGLTLITLSTMADKLIGARGTPVMFLNVKTNELITSSRIARLIGLRNAMPEDEREAIIEEARRNDDFELSEVSWGLIAVSDVEDKPGVSPTGASPVI